MLEQWLLLAHVIGATALFGTGAGIAFFMVMAHRTRNPVLIAHVAATVVVADTVFTATAAVLQPVTGYLLARSIRLGAFGRLDCAFADPLRRHWPVLAAGRLDPDPASRSRPRRLGFRKPLAACLFQPLPHLVCLRLSGLRSRPRHSLADADETGDRSILASARGSPPRVPPC